MFVKQTQRTSRESNWIGRANLSNSTIMLLWPLFKTTLFTLSTPLAMINIWQNKQKEGVQEKTYLRNSSSLASTISSSTRPEAFDDDEDDLVEPGDAAPGKCELDLRDLWAPTDSSSQAKNSHSAMASFTCKRKEKHKSMSIIKDGRGNIKGSGTWMWQANVNIWNASTSVIRRWSP